MARQKRYNPERNDWRGHSYRKGGEPVRYLRERLQREEKEMLEEVEDIDDIDEYEDFEEFEDFRSNLYIGGSLRYGYED